MLLKRINGAKTGNSEPWKLSLRGDGICDGGPRRASQSPFTDPRKMMRRQLARPSPPLPPSLPPTQLLLPLLLVARVLGIDNGLGVTPPQGWRSWNAYDCTSDDRIITQAHVEAQFAAAVDTSRLVDGVPTSLAQLGFEYISIDDGRVTLGAAPSSAAESQRLPLPAAN